MSSECLQRILAQKHYILRDSEGNIRGTYDSTENIVVYKDDVPNYTSLIIITLFNDNGNEIYSLPLGGKIIVDNNNHVITNEDKYFNLVNVSEKYTFNNLQYILSSLNGKPLPRTLIFTKK